MCSTANEEESQEKEWCMNRNADESWLSFSGQNVTKHTVASTPCVHAPSAVVRVFKGWTAALVSVFLLSHSLKPVLTAHAEMSMGVSGLSVPGVHFCLSAADTCKYMH